MKKVEISKVIVKEYTEKELVAFIANRLSSLSKVHPATAEDAGYVLGSLTMSLTSLAEVAKALDEKMNGKAAPIVL